MSDADKDFALGTIYSAMRDENLDQATRVQAAAAYIQYLMLKEIFRKLDTGSN